MTEFKETIVEFDGEKYVLWHHIDAYKVNESIFATPLKDWEKLNKEYEDIDEYYCQFSSIMIVEYKSLKESMEEILEEEEY